MVVLLVVIFWIKQKHISMSEYFIYQKCNYSIYILFFSKYRKVTFAVYVLSFLSMVVFTTTIQLHEYVAFITMIIVG